ncbi:hypothetical protein D9758_003234 [Tetrapyrgos nigripes]|uniref:Translation initiation factor eIF2B subunit epsilon n=1 Tax=Tetrapyrgos nigripes TaxID=182062 RepID=A0A8H5GIB8_9AGAR|nr:hypothetical protein D9758_003234 [Tetrapyrgos nigripes]
MPPKFSTGKEKLLGDEDEVLQAVVLADSFNKRFRPLTTRKPRCLLPICNAPLLDWTFESLALAGVQEIFVICRSHSEQVKNAIAYGFFLLFSAEKTYTFASESRWSKPGSGIKIVPIMTAKETFSPGDAMRDIYTRGLVTGDFVLVMGDLVSNVKIDEVVKAHKERRKTNKDAIMTMVVKESGSKHRTRPTGNSSIFVIDPETSECLYYDAVIGYPPKTVANVPREILAEHPEVEIRNDLLDCSIDVCSVEVPSLFQDNFDYLDIRRDFVHGVLTSDLLMKNIYCYVAKEGYAARVQDTKSYQSISKDIISRWTFPLVPDNNHPGGEVYEHRQGNKYIARDGSVVLARTSRIGNNCLIGPSTQVSDDAQIISSVIGRNCVIGAGTLIDNSYVFDGTTIGPGCIVQQSIIGSGVNIRENTRISKGSLVADEVVVGPNAVLEPFQKLSKKRADGDDEDIDSEEEDLEFDEELIKAKLGTDSNAIIWPRDPPDEDEDEEGIENYKNQRFMRLGDDVADLAYSDEGSLSSDEDTDLSDSDSDSDMYPGTLPTSSTTSLTLESSVVAASDAVAVSEFQAEVTQSLERAFAEGHSVDNAAVELKTLRMASNVPLLRVREAVIAAIVEKIEIVEGGGIPQRQEIAKVINRWGPLIDKIGGVDAVETVTLLQSHCAKSKRLPLFPQILVALYQADIVEEVDMRKWHANPASKGEGVAPGPMKDGLRKCWDVGAAILEQLNQQESDSEEESG